jgi:hypothetical protein
MKISVLWNVTPYRVMETVRSPETSVSTCQTTICYIPEHSQLRTRRRENLKSRLIKRV